MQAVPASNPFMRADTLTGTCQAISEDFGFNPLFLRVAFAFGLFWSAGWTVGVYLALGCAVLVSRLIFPDRKALAEGVHGQPAEPQGDNDETTPLLAEAA